MPIVERQARRAFERFEAHMYGLVKTVLPLPAGVTFALKWRETSGVLQFVRGGVGTTVPITTKFGDLHLSLNQDLIVIREGLGYRLRTRRYQYKLLPSGNAAAEALIRWEFDAETDMQKECRHHMHINTALPVGDGTLALRRSHIPTAYVLIEHVLRFLFHDLEVAPRTETWPDLLRESETKFFEQFSGKRYRWRP